mmetsp:Transcript_34586/g.107421  ORF Transcript_34586/g.107421 Transcript_34586/m.107421 type:complete len:279 (-) Transcript_34586:655-1491(-)
MRPNQRPVVPAFLLLHLLEEAHVLHCPVVDLGLHGVAHDLQGIREDRLGSNALGKEGLPIVPDGVEPLLRPNECLLQPQDFGRVHKDLVCDSSWGHKNHVIVDVAVAGPREAVAVLVATLPREVRRVQVLQAKSLPETAVEPLRMQGAHVGEGPCEHKVRTDLDVVVILAKLCVVHHFLVAPGPPCELILGLDVEALSDLWRHWTREVLCAEKHLRLLAQRRVQHLIDVVQERPPRPIVHFCQLLQLVVRHIEGELRVLVRLDALLEIRRHVPRQIVA